MAFLSELIGRPVADLDGKIIGNLKDVIAFSGHELVHPEVVGISIKQKNKVPFYVPYSSVAVLLAPVISLKHEMGKIIQYRPTETDIFLAADVFDKQIIDVDDIRVVRVNDIELVRIIESIYASNVDVSALGLLRRMGFGGMAEKIPEIFKTDVTHNMISWDYVELLPSENIVRLRVSGEKIANLHPADLANIIGDMNKSQTSQFLNTLSTEQLADALEEVEEDFQVSLVENMDDEKVADVLEEMAPDEAADLLAELPKERSEKLIELMEDDEAEDVRKLLGYPEESAGGIMTTDFITTPEGIAVEDAIRILRENAQELETFFYVYVTDSNNKMVGVYSLSELILANPGTLIDEIMHKRFVSVSPLDSQNHVAQLISRYSLLAIPVLDEEGIIHGIVTSDDALDKIIPTVWKKRLPRYYK